MPSSDCLDEHDSSYSPITAGGSEHEGRSIFVSAPDGLRLHAREHGAATAPAMPVVCLPGLTRTTADFDDLARALTANKPPRRVIALDSRGRGQSAYDPNPKNYTPAVESSDLLAVLNVINIPRAVFVGSSRGGILTMLLALIHSEMIAAAVLHDIGPVIEPTSASSACRRTCRKGRKPFASYLARNFPSWLLRNGLGQQNTPGMYKLESWCRRMTPALAESLADFDVKHPLPPLWNEFDALGRVPVLVIHGANSDILSPATIGEMRAHHSDLEVIEVADQGHVPFLDTPELIDRIAAFIRPCETAASPGAKS